MLNSIMRLAAVGMEGAAAFRINRRRLGILDRAKELVKQASRRMDATQALAAILRDGASRLVRKRSSRRAQGRAPQSLTQKGANGMALYGEARHARPCAGHPRPCSIQARKTWMAGTKPGHDGK